MLLLWSAKKNAKESQVIIKAFLLWQMQAMSLWEFYMDEKNYGLFFDIFHPSAHKIFGV